ncbi:MULTISPECIES: glycosyltransferase [Nonomuraea]|uniref:Glycosyltransferase n=1 Tax=Nonomuraea ferruginea TaxID=46174 RepID=A0ABT4T8Y4_9ACTN|nr:glycosyltransferase [Nonomuraea ferruginea]MDA0645910.1 glycosyltransferase [Nonomuraea ferruginea]
MTTVIMVTHGTHGDVLPFVGLGRILRERGHRVEILTHAPFEAVARREGLEFTPIDTEREYERYLSDTPMLLGAGMDRWRRFYDAIGLFDQIRFECEVLKARHVPGETVFVGRHTTAISTLFAGEVLDVPTAWVAVTPVQYMSERPAVHMYRETMSDRLDAVRATLGLGPVGDWTSWFTSARLHLGLWPEWFDRAGVTAPSRVRLTGAPYGDDTFTDPVPPEAERLLDRGAVIVTGGTGRMIHERFYAAAVAACAAAGVPALVVARHRDLVPADLPQDVSWFPHLPFHQVMGRARAVLHHGGIGTVVRAVAAGVPQVLLAHGFDRSDNGMRLARLGLGSWLPERRWTTEEIVPLLNEALAADGHRERVAPYAGAARPGLRAAAEAVEELLHV